MSVGQRGCAGIAALPSCRLRVHGDAFQHDSEKYCYYMTDSGCAALENRSVRCTKSSFLAASFKCSTPAGEDPQVIIDSMRRASNRHVATSCVLVVVMLVSTCTATQSSNRRALRDRKRDELMAQFIAAATSGNMELTQQMQTRLLQLDEQRYQQNSKRKLLQTNCAALQDLLACADFGCVTTGSALTRGADGNIQCVTPPATVVKVDVQNFAYFLPYDYDGAWDTDADNVLTGASTTTTDTNTNEFTSSDGKAGYNSRIEGETNTRTVPYPLFGTRADDSTRVDLYNTEFSVGTDPQAAVTLSDSTNAGFTTSGTYGAYLPGTTAKARDVKNGGSEDNVVFTVKNLGAMSGYHSGH